MGGWISHAKVEFELGWAGANLLPLPVVKEPVSPYQIIEESDRKNRTHLLDYDRQIRTTQTHFSIMAPQCAVSCHKRLTTKVGCSSADSTNSGGEEVVRTQIASHPVSRYHGRRVSRNGRSKARSA